MKTFPNYLDYLCKIVFEMIRQLGHLTFLLHSLQVLTIGQYLVIRLKNYMKNMLLKIKQIIMLIIL
jgi:hypothetical protein